MVGVGAQYLLMPLMSKYLRWSDTTILIVSFPFLFCSHLGHNNRAKNRRSHQARKEIGKLLFLHVKLKLDCFWNTTQQYWVGCTIPELQLHHHYAMSPNANACILGHDVGMHCESLCDSFCDLRVATLCRHALLCHCLLCYHTMQIHDKQICGPARSRKSLCHCGCYTGMLSCFFIHSYSIPRQSTYVVNETLKFPLGQCH